MMEIYLDHVNISVIETNFNEAPNKPVIDGKHVGKPGVPYEFTFTTIDPENHQLYYYVDWGDNSVQDWFGPFDSGENATASHSWSQGNYEIRVKAKDEFGLESEWSDPLEVSMSRSRSIDIFNPWLFRLIQRFTIHEFLL